MIGALLLLSAFVGSVALTYWVRRFALSRAILDIPNARSSHVHVTPRGGGLAIAVALFSTAGLAGVLGLLPLRVCVAVLGGGFAVAVVGWVDDVRRLSPLLRAVVHLAAAGWAVAWLGGMPYLSMEPRAIHLAGAGSAVAVLAIAWSINLYNFMDGIDGLAGAEAVLVGGGGAFLLSWHGDPSLSLMAGLVASASAGFLVWNWPPARIFMGDVGSGLLGYVFGVLAVASERTGSLPALAWATLLAVFVVDATVTLLRRVARGERWYLPHRSHAYQRLAQAGWSHRGVVAGVALVDLSLFGAVWAGLRSEVVGVVFAGALAAVGLAYWAVERVRPMTALETDDR